eukprot:1785055-Pyramimonas_sp.AAC.1
MDGYAKLLRRGPSRSPGTFRRWRRSARAVKLAPEEGDVQERRGGSGSAGGVRPRHVAPGWRGAGHGAT